MEQALVTLSNVTPTRLTPSSSVMTLWQHAGSGEDEPMDFNTPINATTDDKFHMSFSYICE